MPVAILRYSWKIPENVLRQLTEKLPSIISDALDISENPNARLTSSDIEVWTQKTQNEDVNTKDLEILIHAHQYPERLLNVDERKDKVVMQVRVLLAENKLKIKGWVWILLQPSSFGQI